MIRLRSRLFALGVGVGVGVGVALTGTVGAPRTAAADTTSECLTAHETSVTSRRSHDLRTARVALRACAMAYCPADVRSECGVRLREVESALPTVVFDVKDPSGHDVPRVLLTVDGEPSVLDGFPVEVNPGDHVFRFAVAGWAPVDMHLTMRASEKNRREAVVLTPPVAAPVTPQLAAADAGAPAPSIWPVQKTLAIVAGGLGVAALATGTAFGLSASASWNDAQRTCASAVDCRDRPRALSERSDAQRSATVSTITLGVGAAALVTAIVLWVTSPKPNAVRLAPAAHDQRATGWRF